MESDFLVAARDLFGNDVAQYLAHKNSGGEAGRKGTRYEDLFLVSKVVDELACQAHTPHPDWPRIGGQELGFVDDVVVLRHDESGYYQCKNTGAIRWDGSEYPLEEDFARQKAIADKLSFPNPRTYLVSSDQPACTRLRNGVPASIQSHTDVEFFPYCEGSAFRPVHEHAALQDTLRQIAKSAQPKLDDLFAAFAVLEIASLESHGIRDIREIVGLARQVSPQQIRRFPTERDWRALLDPQFVEILARIAGLGYDTGRGYFEWHAFGTSGIFSFDCEDEQFRRFQSEVILNQPATFEELESLFP